MNNEDLEEQGEMHEKGEVYEKTEEIIRSTEDVKNIIKGEIENSIKEFLLEDNEVLNIEKSVGLLKKEEVEEIKDELNLENKLKEIDKEAEQLKADTENLLGINEKEQKSEYVVINENTRKKIETLLLAKEELAIAERELSIFETKSGEMEFKQFELRRKALEVKIFKEKGLVYENSEGVSELQIDTYNEKRKEEKGIIRGKTDKEIETELKLEKFISNFKILEEKIGEMGVSMSDLDRLSNSTDENDKKLIEKAEKLLESLNVQHLYDDLRHENPGVLLDAIAQKKINDPFLKNLVFDNSVGDRDISLPKLINVVFSEFITPENEKQVLEDLDYRIQKDRQEALRSLPVYDILASWEKDLPTGSWGLGSDTENNFGAKFGIEIDRLCKDEKFDEIKNIRDRLEAFDSTFVLKFSEALPKWLSGMNINSDDSFKILTKQLSADEFLHYSRYGSSLVPFNLIPEGLSAEDREKYEEKCFHNPSLENFEYYSKLKGVSMEEAISKGFDILSENISYAREKIEKTFEISRQLQFSDDFYNNKDIKDLASEIYKIGIFAKREDLDDLKKTLGLSDDESSKVKRFALMSTIESWGFSKIGMILRNGEDASAYLEDKEIKESIVKHFVSSMQYSFDENDLVDVKEKFKITNEEACDYIFNHLDFIRSNKQAIRIDKTFDIVEYAEKNGLMTEKIGSIKRLRRTKEYAENIELLPSMIKEKMVVFEHQYGKKGINIMNLALYAYGADNPKLFVSEMEKIENGLNKYNPDNIPEGAMVSMGAEYEVTKEVADPYLEKSFLGYKSDIEAVSEIAGIGKGKDAIHEIALKPNYNPYMLLAEMKLLQDSGFLDLTFDEYPEGPHGYHLSIVGDSGLELGSDMYFLSNVLALTQLSGITAGLETTETKAIHSKDFESFTNHVQKGRRCEIKNMSTDSVEQFEKAVLTSHNAGVAMQVNNKYLGESMGNLPFVPDTEEEFEKMLLEDGKLFAPFETDKDRSIVYNWNKLKFDTKTAVDSHNSTFLDTEIDGGFLNKDGLYVETLNGEDWNRNARHLKEGNMTRDELSGEIALDSSDLFTQQTPRFINGLTKINNFYLLKRTIPDESSYILEKQEDGTMKKVLNLSNIVSMFNMKDEGGIVRSRDGDSPQKVSLFDKGGEARDGYYTVQGASEEMIIPKAQIILNRFNKNMEKLLSEKTVKREAEILRI